MLLDTLDRLLMGEIQCTPFHMPYDDEIEQRIKSLEPMVQKIFGAGLPTRWLTLRLLDGDKDLLRQVEKRNTINEVCK
ncbi:hypothetical protein FO520_24845 [Bacillus subtilis]